SRHPGKVITYVSDAISVAPAPLRLWQTLWSGKLFAVKTARTLELSARGEAMEMGHTLPVLSNCVVPRAIVDTIVEQFGDLCISTTADSCFAYRFCALYDDYLHFDRALAILYGSHRSAGLGYLKGEGGDFADYLRTWHGDTWLDAAPIPGVNLGYNMLFHEYELVRRSPAGKRLPPLDREGYLRDLARGLVFVEDDQQREKLRRLLEEHGWKGELPAYTPAEPRSGRWRRVVRTLRQRAALFTAARFDRQPRSISGFAFRSDEEALHYALRFPRQPAADAEHLSLVEPVEVGMAAP
ncbi:MAG: hypothetical protein M3Q69_21360, partial [Acidobacteriota bacterium]|nr:hypothetical protein [Acidobacteriota bacterium]